MDRRQVLPRAEQHPLQQPLISHQGMDDEGFEIIGRASVGSFANESADKSVLSPSGSKSLHRDMVGTLTTPMSDVSQVPYSPPRNGTPIPETYHHAVPNEPTLAFDVVRLQTPSTPSPPIAEDLGKIDLSAERDAEEALELSAEPVLGKAYSTVISSSNRPVGHRSSPSLRHIVFSRTTSTSRISSPKSEPEDFNSSIDSFVKITGHEGDSTADGAHVLYSPSQNKLGVSRSSSFADDSDIATAEGKEQATMGPGRQRHENPISHLATPPESLNPANTSPLPETSILPFETSSGVPSPLSFLASVPDPTAHSAGGSPHDLSRSYDSALDPNNLKYWWDAGVRDGDPVGTPSSRDSPPFRHQEHSRHSRHQEHVRGGAQHGISSEKHTDQLSAMPSHAFAESGTQHDIEIVSKSDSDESVEQGREIAPSFSNGMLSMRRTAGGQALLKIEEGDEEKEDGEDATGGSLSWLEPLEVLLQDAPNSDSNDEPQSIRSLPFDASSGMDVGILSPEKEEVERVPTPSIAASVDPSDLHISHEIKPWDPLVNGTYVTFKFLLFILANTLRCQPQQLPYHPITSYIAKFAMIPETDLRRLFSNELSYAAVSDYHLTHHELFLWYKQIFRTTQPSSGNFQTVICALIQIGLEHPVQSMEYTVQKLQSNPNIICLLSPGGCAVHNQPEDDQEFEAQNRPHTSYGNHHTSHSRDLRRESKEIVVELDTFAFREPSTFLAQYNIKEDLDLSSSSESSSHLSTNDTAAAACTRDSAANTQDDFNANDYNSSRFHSASGENESSNEAKITGVRRDKGKARARMDLAFQSHEPYNATGDASSTMHVIPVTHSLAPTSSSVEKSIIAELMFSDSKWNVFNRVLGLLSHSLQVPWNEVLETPRCVYSLVHDAGVSVENFQKWVISAEGEEKAEQEQSKVEPNCRPWRATTDIEGRWNGESLLAATRAVIRNLRTHLESPSGNYLAPEARDELKEFVRVQELQIGSSSKDWQGDEAMDILQTAQLMIG
ncbi:hypothetical protein QFC19_004154 [Naganishia cerealis]|uniref:Uncharacterized protein n=1 Tax=Naganishia cerealis TaxID=610337 RepID=A0ACC2VX19_9TREE|nr:hypothetical protein QFC19_004154 [Naganishia cerealis]